MRKLLFVFVLLIACVACGVALGYYRGWFVVEKTHDSETGREGVQIGIDRNKMNPDIEKAKENVDKVKEKIGAGSKHGEKPEGQQP